MCWGTLASVKLIQPVVRAQYLHITHTVSRVLYDKLIVYTVHCSLANELLIMLVNGVFAQIPTTGEDFVKSPEHDNVFRYYSKTLRPYKN